MFLKPLPPFTTTPKTSKGTGARVLTRNEILAAIEEKEREKKQAAEEKAALLPSTTQSREGKPLYTCS